MTKVLLPAALRAQIMAQVKADLPGECCGLVEGERDEDRFMVMALHPARNVSDAADRFAMDPRDQFMAQKAARANGRKLIGCYHSHPNGAAQPSAADLAGAQENGFLWLIAAPDKLSAFVYRDGRFDSCVTGADWVTSSE